MLRMVCGYRRTGKDTLLEMFNNQRPFQWLVYGNKKKFEINTVERISFADNLRKEVDYIYQIQPHGDYSQFKETVVYGDKTYRDLLIRHAEYRREQDVNYWVKNATDWKKIQTKNIMITDWRYLNELNWVNKYNPETIRLFRSDVPIPEHDVSSEHQLDSLVTDFLLVPNKEDFSKACKIFPQYSSFQLCYSDFSYYFDNTLSI